MALQSPNPALDGQSKVPSTLIVLIVGCGLSSTVVFLRLFTRISILKSMGIDDWFIIAAQILAIASAAAIGLESHYGMGRHIWMVPQEHIVPYFQSLYASILLYNAALTMVKISLLLQYRRIFAIPSMRRATTIALLIVCSWGFTVIVMLSMICVPIQGLWDRTLKAKCLPLIPAYYAPAAINIATDFMTWVLPLPVIKSLQLPRRQKIVLMLIFGLGFFTCITSLVRLSTLKQATQTTDPTWDNTDAATWSYLELSMAILAASLPTLRPLAMKLMPRFLNDTSVKSSNGYIRQPGENRTWRTPKQNVVSTEASGTTSTEALNEEGAYTMKTIMIQREYDVKSDPVGARRERH